MKKLIKKFLLITLCFLVLCCCANKDVIDNTSQSSEITSFNIESIPEFTGSPYVVVNNNIPNFSAKDITDVSFEKYSPLDSLGRCSVAIACIGRDIMPTEERGSIGQVKPSGWQTVKYDGIDGKYLYNRCHLIGFQLTGENANECNLITGTRYMNVEGMLPFENMIADYVKETGNHIVYRVTPIFKENELVARGVQLEALSVEDNGEGVCFNVYVYNNQPGIRIDYKTGNSDKLSNSSETVNTSEQNLKQKLILNTSSKKIHHIDCSGAKTISENNKETYLGDIDILLSNGYTKCKICFK